MRRARCWLAGAVLASCHPPAPGAPAVAAVGPALEVAVEGPCSLDVVPMGAATVVVYGTTGVGARQSIARVRPADGAIETDPALLRGVDADANAWVRGAIAFRAAGAGETLLDRTETTLASPGSQGQYDFRTTEYARRGGAWVPIEAGASPPPADAAPPLPVQTMCDRHAGSEGARSWLHFEARASATTRSGARFVAGRCQNGSMAGYRPVTIMLARWLPGAAAWEAFDAPETKDFDYIVSIGIDARGPDEAYLVVWEPMEVEQASAKSYLARFDGTNLKRVPAPAPLTSVALADDGTLWVTGAGKLWQRPRGLGWEAAAPPLPADCAAQKVKLLADQPWVIAQCKERNVLLRAEHRRPPLHCDPSERADRALRGPP